MGKKCSSGRSEGIKVKKSERLFIYWKIMSEIHVYCDGACRSNPGIGGFGVLVVENGVYKTTVCGYEEKTTNNRMELTAAINSIKILDGYNGDIVIFSDSRYVCQGMTSWINGWKSNGWKTRAKTSVLNIDLWKELDTISTGPETSMNVSGRNIEWKWVKGHSGNKENDFVDKLANDAIDKKIKHCIKDYDDEYIDNSIELIEGADDEIKKLDLEIEKLKLQRERLNKKI